MSETETHSGRFKIICTNDEDTKKFIKDNLSEWWTVEEYETKFNTKAWCVNETKAYDEKYWSQHIPFEYEVIPVKDQHWLIKYEKHKEFDEGEPIAEMTINPDGTYDFLAQFYNGGTYLGEMIGYMIEKKVLKE